VPGIGGIQAAVQVFNKGEDLLADHAEHLLGLELPETRPAQIVLTSSEDRFLDRFAKPVGFPEWRSSSRLMNSRKEICSITRRGSEIPPDQKASHILSIFDLFSPVNT
jgi:hypothetical protein